MAWLDFKFSRFKGRRGLGSHDLPTNTNGDVDSLESWLISETDPADTAGTLATIETVWISA